eukprot:SAG11_NODE_2410_length_3394_cov_2.519575_1_plen_194_part_00
MPLECAGQTPCDGVYHRKSQATNEQLDENLREAIETHRASAGELESLRQRLGATGAEVMFLLAHARPLESSRSGQSGFERKVCAQANKLRQRLEGSEAQLEELAHELRRVHNAHAEEQSAAQMRARAHDEDLRGAKAAAAAAQVGNGCACRCSWPCKYNHVECIVAELSELCCSERRRSTQARRRRRRSALQQ